MDNKKKALGRGLSALMGDLSEPLLDVSETRVSSDDAISTLPLDKVAPNINQPRRSFDEKALKELSKSIKSKGIIQPIVVRYRKENNNYEIIAGERRWRAAQIAQLQHIPVVVRDLRDDETIEIALIENIQRENLNSIEEAHGFRQLIDKFNYTQENLANVLSKSRSYIANTLRLLNLSDDLQNLVKSEKLSAGHARVLIGLENPEDIATKIIKESLSVRQVENLVKKNKKEPGSNLKNEKIFEKDADTQAIEADLSAILSMHVLIEQSETREEGIVKIKYKTFEQLDRLCQILSLG